MQGKDSIPNAESDCGYMETQDASSASKTQRRALTPCSDIGADFREGEEDSNLAPVKTSTVVIIFLENAREVSEFMTSTGAKFGWRFCRSVLYW